MNRDVSGGEVGVRDNRMLGVLMTNSVYVARVGGLAVALGIGAAVATGHETAWAETPDSSSDTGGASTSSVSGAAESGATQSGSTGDPTATTAPTTDPAPPSGSESSSSSKSPSGDTDEKSPSQSSVDLGGGVVI